MVTALNPKSIVFFIALLPQFISPAHPLLPQLWILGLTFVTMAMAGGTLLLTGVIPSGYWAESAVRWIMEDAYGLAGWYDMTLDLSGLTIPPPADPAELTIEVGPDPEHATGIGLTITGAVPDLASQAEIVSGLSGYGIDDQMVLRNDVTMVFGVIRLVGVIPGGDLATTHRADILSAIRDIDLNYLWKIDETGLTIGSTPEA